MSSKLSRGRLFGRAAVGEGRGRGVAVAPEAGAGAALPSPGVAGRDGLGTGGAATSRGPRDASSPASTARAGARSVAAGASEFVGARSRPSSAAGAREPMSSGRGASVALGSAKRSVSPGGLPGPG